MTGQPLRVLGIDPGTRFMGYGVVEETDGQLVHLGHGVIKTSVGDSLERRLLGIFSELQAVVARYRPAAMAVEGLFSCRNARSALILGHARGVALLAAAQGGLPVFEYAPARVKRAVGAGGADAKEAVARMVRTFLSLSPERLERSDASDALAVAICHLNRRPDRALASSPRGSGWEGRLSAAYQRFPTGSGGAT